MTPLTGAGFPELMRARLRDQLIRHEGMKLRPYRDTVGKLTIGVGRNLDDVGIYASEARVMLDNDIDNAIRSLMSAHEVWFGPLDPVRQAAVVNMAFNLGPSRFNAFVRFIGAMRLRDYPTAALEMLDSKWAVQVGDRAMELSGIIRRGLWSVPE